MISKEEVVHSITKHFGHIPTQDQAMAISHLAAFAMSRKPNPTYLLKGYAGTGKTSLISAFVRMLAGMRIRFVLMAPTGRAAKVLSQYTGYSTATIHRRIYLFVTNADGITRMVRTKNKLENAIFVVDEASMISDTRQQEGIYSSHNNLLDDLMDYVFSGQGNKLLLVGDTAQLPPVGLDLSPALDIDYLKTAFTLTGYAFEMKEVRRQSLESGILFSATILRTKIAHKDIVPPYFHRSAFKKDVEIVQQADVYEEYLQQAFYSNEDEKSIIVCRSNKRANLFNKQVRERILQREQLLEAGDRVMIVKNDYFWMDDNSNSSFIANGDIAEVLRIVKTEELYGFHFAEAEIRLTDYPDLKEITVKLLLDTLEADSASLSEEDHQRLFEAVQEDYMDIPSYRKRMDQMKKNPFYNALQIKFAYAMTCHKTQGGQWPYVFIDQGYVNDEMLNIEYLRWLYTALTRATEKVFLVNFQDDFFLEESPINE